MYSKIIPSPFVLEVKTLPLQLPLNAVEVINTGAVTVFTAPMFLVLALQIEHSLLK